MKEQRITVEERVERILDRLWDRARDKALARKIVKDPILEEREFFNDMRELPDEYVLLVEEQAQLLEEAVETGKLGWGPRDRAEARI